MAHKLSLKNKTHKGMRVCVCLSVCMCVYRGVSVVDDLPHEIGIKHSFSYNGEPCEKVTHTQSPQLPGHLSREEKKSRLAGEHATESDLF